MVSARTTSDRTIRLLKADDLEQVITIDRMHTGQARRRFFEKRFEAAKTHPADFIHVGVTRDGSLAGFAFARLLHGEFGREHTAILDAVGVDPGSQERGVGPALMQALIEAMRRNDVRALQSQADWTNHGLMRFFDTSGFKLAPRLVLARSVAEPLAEPVEEI